MKKILILVAFLIGNIFLIKAQSDFYYTFNGEEILINKVNNKSVVYFPNDSIQNPLKSYEYIGKRLTINSFLLTEKSDLSQYSGYKTTPCLHYVRWFGNILYKRDCFKTQKKYH